MCAMKDYFFIPLAMFLLFISSSFCFSQETLETNAISDAKILSPEEKEQRLIKIESELMEAHATIKTSREKLFNAKRALETHKRQLVSTDESAAELQKDIVALTQQLAEKQKQLDDQLKKNEDFARLLKEVEDKQSLHYQAIETNQKLLNERRELQFGATTPDEAQ